MFLVKILLFVVYRKNYMILCSPSPGTQQSEKNIFKCFQFYYISLIILSLRLMHKSYRNWVPGEMEFCWKNYLFSTPIYYTTFSKTYYSLDDLNLRSLKHKRLIYLDWLILALGATPSNAIKIISLGLTTSINSWRYTKTLS